MWIHWKRHVLCFTHRSRRITLHGVSTKQPKCTQVSAQKVSGMLQRGALTHVVQITGNTCDAICYLQESADVVQHALPLPPMIAELVAEYEHLFAEPTKLPPRRSQDHQIPLIPGAQPVKSRPYRYTPAHKDEIEHQVYDMLCTGIIQRSSSPFVSPVLLVRKKDGQ